MAKVTITDRGTLDPTEAIAFLEGCGHEVTLLDTLDPQELLRWTPDCEALLASFIDLSAETLGALPNLRVIATATVGFNRIDIAAARERGVDVCNMPSIASEEVANHTLAGILAMTRELRAGYEHVEQGGWDYSILPMQPRLSEMTLGLFSFGRIAQHVAARATPFFEQVVAYDPYLPTDRWNSEVRRLNSVDELLEASDILSLHALLTDETRGVLDDAALAKLPPGAYVCNVARGELIDERALLEALDSGQLSGAFLDVLTSEPPEVGNALVDHPRVLVTPHSAFRSASTIRDYLMKPAENIDLVLNGKEPHTLVN